MMIVCLLLCLFLILSFLVYASYSIQSGIYLRSFCKKRTTEKVVALTFDDGPDPIQTPKVLKVLKEYQATACFFCIGHKIKGNEALLKSMVTEGHLIGNHSYSHSGLFPLYGLSKMKKDLQTCQCELERVTSQPVTLFRPPFGVTNPTIAKAVRQLGWGYDDWIGPVWDAAMFIVPMAIYHYYGDTRSIEKLWPVCTKYLAYLAGREDAEGTVTYGIGDWVFHKTQTPTEFTTTCYYYLDNLYMAKFAELIGKDGSSYAKKAEELKLLINHKYFDTSKAIYANGSQAAQGVALYLGIVPKEYEQQVADNLSTMIKANKNLLDFGVLGSKTVLRMLSKYGYADLAYQMAAQEEAPSWGNWIKQGFTTLAETWILSPEFRDASVNHMFLGDINAWMYNILAGINYDEQKPGFKHILIQPHFVKGLDWVKAEYKSVNGIIRSEWERKGEQVILKVTIPVNTNATVEYNGKKIDLRSGKHQLTF